MKTTFTVTKNLFVHRIFTGVAVVGLLGTLQSSRAALLSYEGFDYPEGTPVAGQAGGTGFSQAWQPNGGGGTATNLVASLGYTDAQGNRLLTTGGSLFLQGSTTDAANSAAAQPNRNLSYARGTNSGGTDGVTTWVSFLAVRQGPANGAFPGNPYPRSAGVSLYNTGTEKLGMGNTTPANGALSNVVSILPLGVNPRPSSVLFSQTNLIVVRIDHVSGGLDNAYLFVNPLLGSEPTLSQADTNSLGAFDFSLNRIRPFAGGDRTTSASTPYAEMVIDEIRIGESFADVAPYAPRFTALNVSGTNVTLNWSASINVAYELQANTDLGTGNWETVTNITATSTNLSVDLTVPPNDPQRFYRVRIP